VKSLFKEVLRVASFNNLSCHTIAVLHLMIWHFSQMNNHTGKVIHLNVTF
jgi:hypothetical protein